MITGEKPPFHGAVEEVATYVLTRPFRSNSTKRKG